MTDYSHVFLNKCIGYIGLVCVINRNTGKNVIMLQKCAKLNFAGLIKEVPLSLNVLEIHRS